MFNWLKKLSIAGNAAAVTFYWKTSFMKVATRHGSSGGRHHDFSFWKDVAEAFRVRWCEVAPPSNDPEGLLEQRLDVYLAFLRDTVLKEAQNGRITTAELEQIGEFIAQASVQELRIAVLSDPVRVSPIFDLLPRDWLETAEITPEQFELCYFQRTGKSRAYQWQRQRSEEKERLEEEVDRELSEKILEHMSKLNQQKQDQFAGDSKKHMDSIPTKLAGTLSAPSENQSPQYVVCPCRHCG